MPTPKRRSNQTASGRPNAARKKQESLIPSNEKQRGHPAQPQLRPTQLRKLPPLALPLLTKHPPTHLQHVLEALPSPLRILPKPLHARLLDLRPNLLPPPTQRRDLRVLPELRPLAPGPRRRKRLVHHRLPTRQDVRPRQVRRAHGDALGGGVDVRGLVDGGGGLPAEQGQHPGGGGLRAGDEALGAEDAGGGVDAAGEGVDGDDVRGFVVPGAVLAPVGGGDFGPGVVEGAG